MSDDGPELRPIGGCYCGVCGAAYDGSALIAHCMICGSELLPVEKGEEDR